MSERIVKTSDYHWRLLGLIALACFISCFAFSQFMKSFSSYTIFLSTISIIVLVIYFIFENIQRRKGKTVSSFYLTVIWIVFATFVIYIVIGEMIYCNLKNNMLQWFFTGIIFVLIICMLCGIWHNVVQQKLSKTEMIEILIIVGFLFRLLYVEFTDVTNLSRQNDAIMFTQGGGHLGYIWTIWNTGELPQSDPRELWEFYQPPFYYLVCGLWVKINSFFNVPIISIAENIQLVSLFCVTGTTIVVDKIIEKQQFSENSRIAMIIFLMIIPYFTYLSGAVNNDSMLLFLFVLSIYFALEWYREPSILRLILTALFTGLTVMSKLSGSLIAPAILFLFGLRLYKDKGKRWKRVIEYLLFGTISLPLGLWWNVRNMIRFNMPFVYFCEASRKSVQYIPSYTVFERFFDFKNQLNQIYIDFFNSSPNVDHNIFVSTIKTLTFTHSGEAGCTPVTMFWGTVVFIFTVLIVLVMVGFGSSYIFGKDTQRDVKVFYTIIIISQLAFYIYFNLRHPFVHNMHARYVLPAIVMGVAMMVGGYNAFMKKIVIKDKLQKVVNHSLLISGFTMISVFITYIFEVLIITAE